MFLSIVILFVINNVSSGREEMLNPSSTTDKCIQAVRAYEEAINPDIDPCEDFYSHVCSKWEEENPIPPDFGQWNQILDLKEETDQKIIKSLSEQNNDCPKYNNYKIKLFNFYNTCLHEFLESNEQPFFDMMRKLGGFPLIGIPLKKNYRWENSLAKAVVKLNLRNVLLSMDIQKDVTSPSKNIIVLDQTTLAKPKGYFLSSESNNGKFHVYKKKILDFFEKFLQGHLKYFTGERNLREMIAFETQLAKIVDESTKRRDPIKEGKTVISEFQRSIPGLNITRFLRKVFSKIIDIDNDTEVYVKRIEYFKGLQDIIKNTKNEVIADYIGWRVLTELMDAPNIYLNDRPSYCSKYMAKYFPLQLLLINLEYFHNNKTEIKMLQDIFLELKVSLVVHYLLSASWISDSTANVAISKMLLMKDGIYDPYAILKNYILLQHFMTAPNESTFDTMRIIGSKLALSKLGTIKEKPNKYDVWWQLLDEFNTFYSQISNTLYIPLHLSSFPFYSKDLPPAINFAGIGSAMAREMVHSFDEIGRNYKANGNYYYWWSFESKTQFDRRKGCFVKQYTSSEEAEIGDMSTLQENIADNIGLRAAYKAYENYVKRCSSCDTPLASLKYTNKQLFFIAYTYSMCGQYRVDTENYEYSYKGYYTSPKYRVTTTLRNFHQFSEVFKCNSSSAMYFDSGCLMN